MRGLKLIKVFVVSLIMILTFSMLIVASVSANASEGADSESLAYILDDPITQQRATMLMELIQKAEAGDADAIRQLKFIGDDIRDVFPNGEFVKGDWRHPGQTPASNWGIRKFDSVNIPTGDATPRMQAASTGLVPYRDPAGVFSRNLLVTRDVGTPIQNEPHLCVNPEDSQNVVIASHNYGVAAAPVHVSFDGGETWQGPQRVPITPLALFSGDPVLACARNNQIYFNFMSLGSRTRNLMGFPINITQSDIAVSTSEDGGLTWDRPSIVATNIFEFQEYPVEITDPETGELTTVDVSVLAVSFLDKNWMTVGPDPNNPDKDILYVSYTKFTSYIMIAQPLSGIIVLLPLQWTSEIEVNRSLDNGNSWEKVSLMDPVPAISDVIGVISGENTDEISYRTVQSSQLNVGPDGTLYVAWYDSTNDGYATGNGEMYVTRSVDKGETFAEPVVAAQNLEVQRSAPPSGFRNNNAPQMATGPDNEVYLVYPSRTSSKPADDGDVYFVRGELNARGILEFTKPVMINTDKTNNLQFFPAVAVGPDGTVHVMWGDTRDDRTGLKYNIYYTQSTDNGKTFGFESNGIISNDIRITDFPSNPEKCFPRGRFIGDYWGIEATATDVYMIWTDCRLGEYGPINSKIGFARRVAISAPEVNLTPSSGPSGQEVTVQAFNFQPDMSVFVRVGADISACGGRTNENGFTECKVLMPITASKGIVDVVVFDESGNQSVASFIADVGIDDLARKDGSSFSLNDSTGDNNIEPQDNVEHQKDYSTTYVFIVVFIFFLMFSLIVLGIFLSRSNSKKKYNEDESKEEE